MTTKIFLGAFVPIIFFGIVYNVVSAYTTNVQMTQSDTKEQALKGEESHEENISRFLVSLEQIDLEVSLMSEEADSLAKLFAKAATSIQELEAKGDFEVAEDYRMEIQEAIERHMERPRAKEADISKNIDVYSRYLTETLIAQASL